LLTGFNRFVGNVRESAFIPSPFGLSVTPIVLYGGNASPVNNGTLNGTGIGQLGCESPPGATTNFDRDLLLRGDTVMLRNFGTGTLAWNGEISLADPKTLLIFLSAKPTGHQVVNGPITGAGQVVIGSTDSDPSAVTYVDLMTAQTFNGGLSLSGGTIGLGNDRALGSHTELIEDIPTEVFNTVRVSGTSMISALGAARSIKNDFVVYANTFGVGGSNAVTITGAINGRGGDYIANIANTATTTFAGMLTGGGFVKVGNGTLVITGENNNFTGPVNIGSATTSGGMVIAKTNNALGSSAGSTSVFDGQNALAFDASAAGGALTFTGETLYLSGAGIGSLGAVRNLNGNNTWNGLIQPSAQYAGAGTATPTLVTQTATIGVDAGTLTVNSAILGDDPGVLNDVGTLQRLGTSIGARKVGAGTLVVGSALLSDTSNSSLYNASVLITGTLDIAQGVVRIKPHSGVTGVSGGRSVVDLGGLKFAGTPTVPVGQLDLNDTAMIIDYADVNSSPLPTVRSYIRAGYKSGSWNGTGIVSSIVAASLSGAGRLGLGYAEAQDLSFSSVFGDSFDQDSLIVRSTYLGDTNLDGKVDVVDLGQMALAWSGPGDWINGDFNYDGVVNVRDLYEMALNWQLGVASPGAAPSLDLLLSSFGLPPIAVPEPSTIGLMAAAALLGLRRRRQSPSSTAAANAASIVRN
jgi:autotransporter-associated beta strand protein